MRPRANAHQPFFILPQEFREWLDECLRDSAIWCLVDLPFGPRYQRCAGGNLDQYPLDGQAVGLRFFLGRRDIVAEPVWTGEGERRNLDFVRSRAVLVVPCILQQGTLVEGAISILPRQRYTEVGLERSPLLEWFGELRKSLAGRFDWTGVRLLVCAPGVPDAPYVGPVIISRLAGEASQAGVELKQYFGNRIAFRVAAAGLTD